MSPRKVSKLMDGIKSSVPDFDVDSIEKIMEAEDINKEIPPTDTEGITYYLSTIFAKHLLYICSLI